MLSGRIQQLSHLAASTYGEGVVDMWTKACAMDGGDAFLHDYVRSRIGTFPGALEFGDLFRLHKAVVKATLPPAQIATPTAILAILDETTRRRLFYVCSLLTHDALSREFRQNVRKLGLVRPAMFRSHGM